MPDLPAGSPQRVRPLADKMPVPRDMLDSFMANEVPVIDAEALQSRVRELRRFL